MLRNWVQILPLFLVKIVARRYCPTIQIGKYTYYDAFPDVYIRSADPPITD